MIGMKTIKQIELEEPLKGNLNSNKMLFKYDDITDKLIIKCYQKVHVPAETVETKNDDNKVQRIVYSPAHNEKKNKYKFCLNKETACKLQRVLEFYCKFNSLPEFNIHPQEIKNKVINY